MTTTPLPLLTVGPRSDPTDIDLLVLALLFHDAGKSDHAEDEGHAVASIGPVTSDALASLGVSVDVQPAESTIEAFAAAMTTATSDYVRALDRISAAVPATLQPKVANLVRLVQARSFSAALAARHPIDSWAATNC